MRFTIVFLLCLFVFTSCDKKEVNQSCEHGDFIAENYAATAKQLIFRDIIRDSAAHPGFANPHFNSKEVDNILDALEAIYRLNIPESDTVFEIAQIRARPFYSMNSLMIEVDTAAPEVKALIDNKPTGNPLLDSLLNEYQFNEVETAYSYPRFNWLTISSEENLNLLPIRDALSKLPFFYHVEFNYIIGGGNNISLKRGNGLTFNFEIGWGDCPAGCIYKRHWVFKVDDHCNASFINSYGQPYPF